MLVAIQRHKPLVEGSAPQTPFERRASFCGCAFYERFYLEVPLCPSSGYRGTSSGVFNFETVFDRAFRLYCKSD